MIKRKNFCCEKMYEEQKNIFSNKLKDHSVVHKARTRLYCIYFNTEKSQRDWTALSPINYCPFCGSYLGKDLSDEWYDTLEKEYGIISPRHNERDKVPPEFWTDEGWKKRGL